MTRQWARGLSAATRERYPALLSYAAMLTPDLEEARRLTDGAIVSVTASLRAPRSDLALEVAIRDHIITAYGSLHAADAKASQVTHPGYGTGHASSATAAYAPPAGQGIPPGGVPLSGDHPDSASAGPTPARLDVGIGVAKSTSPLAAALRRLTPAERVAAVSWWIDGASADDVAERLGTTHNSAVDMLHRAGVALAAATGGSAPARDHYSGGGDVVTVEVSSGGGRS